MESLAVSNLIESSSIEKIVQTEDVNVSVTEAYERGRTDINFFSALAMPEVSLYSLPPFYIAIWQLLTARKTEDIGKLMRFALGLPEAMLRLPSLKS